MAAFVDARMDGYSHEQFVGNDCELTDGQLECPICFKILRDPKQCINGHMFCCSCLKQALLVSPTCAICNCDVDSDNLISVCVFVKDRLNLKCMVCPIVNCEWTGVLPLFDEHFDSCTNNAFKCNISNCSWKCVRNGLFFAAYGAHLDNFHNRIDLTVDADD